MQASSPKIEDGLCLYAIGDIHGHKDKLQQIMAAIIEDARQQRDEIKRLVFLGDYIDRGPDSKGVIEYLLHDLPPSYQTVFIRGNHEDVLLRILNGETERIASWMPFGAAACFTSYGVNPFRPYLRETPEILQAELSHQMPPDHLQFLEDTLLSHVSGDYYFVHAGVRPNIALSQQDKALVQSSFMRLQTRHL
jgi:serine/threonine protein phosphatase 1